MSIRTVQYIHTVHDTRLRALPRTSPSELFFLHINFTLQLQALPLVPSAMASHQPLALKVVAWWHALATNANSMELLAEQREAGTD